MSFKVRLATIAESVDKSRRLELWVQIEDGKGYQPLRGGDVLTLAQPTERNTQPGVQVMKLDRAPGTRDDA